jgi:putative FmdB family regulatory protein
MQEFLQKVNDAPIVHCKDCNTDGLEKMISAAGFQLKGSGWYATDFKSKPAAAPKVEESKPAGCDKGGCGSSDGGSCAT